MLALTKYPNTRIWNNPTGLGETPGGRKVKFGVSGQADLSGITENGCRLEVECKTGAGVMGPKQKAWAKMIELYGGIYLLVRSAEEAEILLDAAVRAKRAWVNVADKTAALEEAQRDLAHMERYSEWVDEKDSDLCLARFEDLCDTGELDAVAETP